MKIENLNIHGGHQNFADIIIQSVENIDDADREIVELIHKEVPDKEERLELIKSLSDVKDPDKSESEKKGGAKALKSFFDSLISESGKQIAQEFIERGGEQLSNFL